MNSVLLYRLSLIYRICHLYFRSSVLCHQERLHWSMPSSSFAQLSPPLAKVDSEPHCHLLLTPPSSASHPSSDIHSLEYLWISVKSLAVLEMITHWQWFFFLTCHIECVSIRNNSTSVWLLVFSVVNCNTLEFSYLFLYFIILVFQAVIFFFQFHCVT